MLMLRVGKELFLIKSKTKPTVLIFTFFFFLFPSGFDSVNIVLFHKTASHDSSVHL